jgi:hypothetical protein
VGVRWNPNWKRQNRSRSLVSHYSIGSGSGPKQAGWRSRRRRAVFDKWLSPEWNVQLRYLQRSSKATNSYSTKALLRSALKVGPKTSRKEPPGSVMARDRRSITGRGFRIVLSRSLAEEVFPFISALGVLVPNRKKMCRCADSQKLQTPK